MRCWGRFSGSVRTRWAFRDSREMQVLEPVWFIDARGKRWLVLGGTIVNGASVPWFFRRLFPIYVGRYRRATVIHDAYCETQGYPSWEVHRMFYEAMRCDGTNVIAAWIMWAAVRLFGPRFKGKGQENE